MKTEVSKNKNAFGDYFEECFVKKAATFLISYWKSPEYILYREQDSEKALLEEIIFSNFVGWLLERGFMPRSFLAFS